MSSLRSESNGKRMKQPGHERKKRKQVVGISASTKTRDQSRVLTSQRESTLKTRTRTEIQYTSLTSNSLTTTIS